MICFLSGQARVKHYGAVGGNEVKGEDDACETRCPRCPAMGSMKPQEQSVGVYLASGVHCFIIMLQLSVICFLFVPQPPFPFIG